MDQLHEWFCEGADMTSPAEYEATLRQLEQASPDMLQYNDSIQELFQNVDLF